MLPGPAARASAVWKSAVRTSWAAGSCSGRRMAQAACNLLAHVLPHVPLRQWVLTLPHELRRRIAYDRELLANVGRIFVSSVLGFYRRRLRGDDLSTASEASRVSASD